MAALAKDWTLSVWEQKQAEVNVAATSTIQIVAECALNRTESICEQACCRCTAWRSHTSCVGAQARVYVAVLLMFVVTLGAALCEPCRKP